MAKKMVLAVEDDASVRDFYEQGLAREGYDVVCMPSSKKAKEFLASKKPDVILMDIMMPGQDGISFTRELSSDPATSGIPIIVVSGLADAGTLNDALLFGAVDYVVKPIDDLEALKTRIERVLAAVQRRKQDAQPG